MSSLSIKKKKILKKLPKNIFEIKFSMLKDINYNIENKELLNNIEENINICRDQSIYISDIYDENENEDLNLIKNNELTKLIFSFLIILKLLKKLELELKLELKKHYNYVLNFYHEIIRDIKENNYINQNYFSKKIYITRCLHFLFEDYIENEENQEKKNIIYQNNDENNDGNNDGIFINCKICEKILYKDEYKIIEDNEDYIYEDYINKITQDFINFELFSNINNYLIEIFKINSLEFYNNLEDKLEDKLEDNLKFIDIIKKYVDDTLNKDDDNQLLYYNKYKKKLNLINYLLKIFKYIIEICKENKENKKKFEIKLNNFYNFYKYIIGEDCNTREDVFDNNNCETLFTILNTQIKDIKEPFFIDENLQNEDIYIINCLHFKDKESINEEIKYNKNKNKNNNITCDTCSNYTNSYINIDNKDINKELLRTYLNSELSFKRNGGNKSKKYVLKDKNFNKR